MRLNEINHFKFFVFLNILYYFGDALCNLIYDYMPSLRIGDVDINEDIAKYWESLDEEDRKWSLKEEENARAVLKTKILTDDQY